MKKIIALLIFGLAIFGSGCYEEYKLDFDYTATYFAHQTPIRTIIAETETGSFEVGVVLAGRRVNNNTETVTFTLDNELDSLIAETDMLLMPESYYTIDLPDGEYTMTIPSGSFEGFVNVNLNAAFFSDSLSATNTYVIPFKLLSTSLDSILAGKEYTMPIVKYINKYHGWYYQKGQQRELDAEGNIVDTIFYSYKDLIDHKALAISTINMNTLTVPALGTSTKKMMILVESDNSLSFEQMEGSVPVTGISGSYLPADKMFYLNYQYENAGKTYTVFDTLIFRNTELKFQTW